MRCLARFRSVRIPQFLTLLGLVLGLPMFLAMPPWVDITLYDVSAHVMLAGGCHYRDVFDTNPPGFVWALTLIRFVFGSSYQALWVVDLAIVAVLMLLVDRLAKWGGASTTARWWAFAGVSYFYPYSSEYIHAQRDVWMSLPALAAILLRVRRTRRDPDVPPSPFQNSLLEGVLWGCAVWVKPHIVVMAAGVWLLTIWRVAGESRGRNAVRDFCGNICGGLLVGGAGLVLLAVSGSWAAFIDVFTNWNHYYTKLIGQELEDRLERELHWFPPWSLLLIPTVPLALLSLLDGRWWSRRANPNPSRGWLGRWLPGWLYDPGADDSVRYARAVLAGCYLIWATQSFFLQRAFEYVHVTETLLMLGLWAAQRWFLPAIVLLWLAATSGLWLASDSFPDLRSELRAIAFDDPERDHYVIRHPLADPNHMRWWTTCWQTDLTEPERARLRDALKQERHHEASVGWEELEEVAAFLRAQPGGIHDREVIAWNDSPHPIYLLLGIKPGIRFMHVYTIRVMGEEPDRRLWEEVEAGLPRARFIVADLKIITLGQEPGSPAYDAIAEPGSPSDLLPPSLSAELRAYFPFDHRAVFRSNHGRGRYVVLLAHELAPQPVDIPQPPQNLRPGLKPVLDFLRQP